MLQILCVCVYIVFSMYLFSLIPFVYLVSLPFSYQPLSQHAESMPYYLKMNNYHQP